MTFVLPLLVDLSTPFKEPVIIFSIVLCIILLSPVLLNRLRIPSIVGMIIAGVVIGPHGFNLLERDGAIVLFGTVGLLYIMFLAGLEIEMTGFKKNATKSTVFGLLTFIIPFIIGYVVCKNLLHLELIPSLITASMFSTQTLIAYPIITRLGITKARPVSLTVGGTIITDTLVLLLFSVITNFSLAKTDSIFWVRLGISVIAFAFIVLYIFPIIAKWFFRKLEGEGGSQFIFVLTIVFLAAFLSQLAGLEHIIGAFLAGIALNRLIPHQSALKNRLVFVGNNIFIPFFLINVGMIINLQVLFNGTYALYVAGVLVVVALSTKYIAAIITQKIYRFTSNEGNLIFGLSTAHAAATLAIILVGFDLGLLSENILNGTIIVILVSCLVSSFVTEAAGRKYVIAQNRKIDTDPEILERILVPVGNPDSAHNLLDLALLIRNPGSKEPIYPLAVIEDDADTKEKILRSKRGLELAAEHISSADTSVQVLTRVDVNIASGISRAIKELGITEVVMGWHEKITTSDRIFGSLLHNIIHGNEQMLWISKIIKPVNTFNKIAVLMPPNAEFESGFFRWLPVTIGGKALLRPARRMKPLPILSMVTVRPASRAHCVTRSRPCLSRSVRVNRQTPPLGVAPILARSMRESQRRWPLMRRVEMSVAVFISIPWVRLAVFRHMQCDGDKPGLAPAGDSLSLASPRESKQRESEPTPGPLRGSLRCSLLAGSVANSLRSNMRQP